MRYLLIALALAGCITTKAPVLPQNLALSPPPKSAVTVEIDDHGIPTIKAKTMPEAMYGLGFMHAQDRLFQLMLMKHAAYGRLTELFGERVLKTDRFLRFLSYGLRDAERALLPEERRAIAAYVDGVNAGAKVRGRTGEMQLLGVDFATFTIVDVLAISRLQTWTLSKDMVDELGHSRLIARLPQDDTRLAALIKDIPDRGIPVIPPVHVPDQAPAVEPPATEASIAEDSLTALWRGLEEAPALFAAGGSNSWAVDGAHSETGKPILCNDPHLAHRLPGIFYLARIEADGVRVMGGTMPGLPAVLIGFTDDIAWSMTVSNVDTQDLVRLSLDSADRGLYLVDGKKEHLQKRHEVFLHKGKTLCEEDYLESLFGPVLPGAYKDKSEPDEVFALQWTGFDKALLAKQVTSFWRLAKSKTVDEARGALDSVGPPSQSVLLIDDENIGFHILGAVPLRAPGQRSDRVSDGTKLATKWRGYVAGVDKPQAANPERGFLVAANQRISSRPRDRMLLGGFGASPSRAMRIKERLTELLAQKKASRAELLAIQDDRVSVQARTLAPILAARCPKDIEGFDMRAHCAALAEMSDGAFLPERKGPRLFDMIFRQLREYALEIAVGADVVDQLVDLKSVEAAFVDAIILEGGGGQSPLFDDRTTPGHDGLGTFMAIATKRALEKMRQEGSLGKTWRDTHTLHFKGPLAAVPLLGAPYQSEEVSLPGGSRSPRAEFGAAGALAITNGSVLRMVVEAGGGAAMILDFGQSGNPGDEHFGDMTADWRKIKPIELRKQRPTMKTIKLR